MRKLATALQGFTKDRNGNFALMTAAAAPVLALSIGFSVNLAQLYNIKSSLQSALDAAVTSTARDITTGKTATKDARAGVDAFLMANGDPELMGERLVLDTLVIDKSAKTIQATAFVDADLFFPVFTGGSMRRVSSSSAALYSDKTIEIAMMLDVTGSMAKKGKVDKIGDLKAAAANAVKTMLKNQDPSNPRVRVALVPYASGVNVGALAPNLYAEPAASSNLPPVAGSSVIKDVTGSSLLPSYADYLSIVGKAFKRPDACATERKLKDGTPDLSADGPDAVRTDKNGKKYYALVNRDDHLSGSGMNKCPDAAVIPLTAEAKPLLDSIDDFEANGYTAGAIAIQWTYYMLSANWRPAIKTAKLGDGPADANPKKIAKVAILMTDGQFNTAFADVGGSYNSQGSKSRANAEGLCSAMKAEGIEVFTIGFDLDNKDMTTTERDQAKGVLKNCASKDASSIKHYFEASTGAELDAAFQEIISNTERLALTQ